MAATINRLNILSPKQIKSVFKDLGLAPKKWLGQNLLVDPVYLRRILDASQIHEGSKLLEIGAGLGVLTEALVESGAEVWALEVDSGFYKFLTKKFQTEDHAHVYHVDALKYNYSELAAKLGPLQVVANLPYNISSRLIFTFHENRASFESLVILLQKEVAERLVAETCTKDYGILTVLLGTTAKIELLFDIPPRAFFPVPDVWSTLVRLIFPNPAPITVLEPRLMTALVKTAFSARRKTLRNTMRNTSTLGVEPEIVAIAADKSCIDLSRRAETLTSLEFASWANEIVRRSGR